MMHTETSTAQLATLETGFALGVALCAALPSLAQTQGTTGDPRTRCEVARKPDMTQPTGVGVQSSASMLREPTLERETP